MYIKYGFSPPSPILSIPLYVVLNFGLILFSLPGLLAMYGDIFGYNSDREVDNATDIY